ncbi:MAG: histidinol dehydrogenase [Synergistaceae bacterium]|jgi:histidinol dehydrogenase/sulfopropanediol 3-dehydrogenase|nr:histidinol dehydrogenase [Synergistaceae bacterium]
MKIFKEAPRKKGTAMEEEKASMERTVREILENVRNGGDKAVLDYAEKFDGYRPSSLRIDPDTVKKAYSSVKPETVENLRFAADRIRNFAQCQRDVFKELRCEITPGITLGHRLIPIKSCGCYVPAGRYPLPSSALMSIIPARIAGVGRIAAASPANKEIGGIHPSVLVGMDIAGADEIYCMGGAQAIAAFAYGTPSVPPVDIVAGPGNRYVTEAKRQVAGTVGIDMLAGPSEVVIIADESTDPVWIAADALSRCEHDPNSWAVLLLTGENLAEKVAEAVDEELKRLETAGLAGQTWAENGRILVVDSIDEAVTLSDEIAPEHLQVMTEDSAAVAAKLRNFGSLFIGRYAPVPFGDYVSGPNHILPTSGCARFSSGVNVNTFLKISSFQEITAEGGKFLSPHCAHLAEMEGLHGHRRSAELRG